jgi:hypothetical protein
MPRRGLWTGIWLLLLPRILGAQTPADPTFTFGGYLQAQYNRTTTPDREPRDEVIFRRAIVGVEVELSERWMGEIQADIAPASRDERIEVRDAYLRYRGWEPRGITVTVGNQKLPFSRSVLISSSRRGLVERPITGERAFGASGRALSARVDGRNATRSLLWSAALASVHHAPTSDQLRLDGLATSRSDWNDGVMFTGRAEWHPRGSVRLEQGAFDVEQFAFTINAGVYHWTNDGDNNLYTIGGRSTSAANADLDRATAVELSSALRAPRLSLDAELHRIVGRTIDEAFSGGVYRHGRAALMKASVEAGYMLLLPHLEVLGALDGVGIEAHDRAMWRAAAGLNWYVYGHRLKFQFMHREVFNDEGMRGARSRATFVQSQIAF